MEIEHFHALALPAIEAGQYHQAWIGAAISGGISLLGGLFGRSDAKKRDKAAAEAAKVPQVTSHTVDLKALATEARAAGFNPMSILGAGGLSAYTTTSVTGHNAMAAVPTAPGIGTVLANAAGTAFNTYQQQAQVAAGRKHEIDLWKMQNSAVNSRMVQAAGGNSRSLSTGAPRITTAGAMTINAELGKVATPEVGEVTVTNPSDWLEVDPTLRNASDSADRSGENELFELIDGLSLRFGDFFYNVTGMTHRERRAVTLGVGKKIMNNVFVSDPLKRGLPSGVKPRLQ